jgi:hypothetical protein
MVKNPGLADYDAAVLWVVADRVVTITLTGEARTVPNLWAILPTSADPALGDARFRETGCYGLIASYQVQGGKFGSIRRERRDRVS